MVSLLASHLPGLPWATVSFYLCPTTACLVCHRLNTSPVYIPIVTLLASHLPGLPSATVSVYLCPTTACLVCHRLNTSPCVYIYGLSSRLPPTRPAMGHCLHLPMPYHSFLPCAYTHHCCYRLPPTSPAMGHCLRLPLAYNSLPSLSLT